jgi:hypothetical protein
MELSLKGNRQRLLSTDCAGRGYLQGCYANNTVNGDLAVLELL